MVGPYPSFDSKSLFWLRSRLQREDLSSRFLFVFWRIWKKEMARISDSFQLSAGDSGWCTVTDLNFDPNYQIKINFLKVPIWFVSWDLDVMKEIPGDFCDVFEKEKRNKKGTFRLVSIYLCHVSFGLKHSVLQVDSPPFLQFFQTLHTIIIYACILFPSLSISAF